MYKYSASNKTKDCSDEDLVKNFQSTHDQYSFKVLVKRYQNRIFNSAYRILGNAEEAEEVVQETCLKVYQNLARFHSGSCFKSWIYRIAHNSCLDAIRVRQRNRIFWSLDMQSVQNNKVDREDSTTIFQVADRSPAPAEQCDLREKVTIIQTLLKELPAVQRMVIVLHDIEGLSYQEIAQITDSGIGTVRSRLHYGRHKLRHLLKPHFLAREPYLISR